MLKKWKKIPHNMKNERVKEYYSILEKKKISLFLKRFLDLLFALLLLVILLPLFILISIAIKIDSKGPVMFRQVRITQYGRKFRIFKFRTMVNNAHELGSQVTVKNDNRVTKIGKLIRNCRLDEIPQLLNIIAGDMTFVGTRPEVEKYVNEYTNEMMVTLLLPAGVTSEASIKYKDEKNILTSVKNVDETYLNIVLPGKMKYNISSIKNFSVFNDFKTIIKTIVAII